MLKHFSEIHAFGRVDSQTSADKVFGVGADCDVFGEGKCASANLLVGLLDLL